MDEWLLAKLHSTKLPRKFFGNLRTHRLKHHRILHYTCPSDHKIKEGKVVGK